MALKLAEEQAQREEDERKEEEANNPMKVGIIMNYNSLHIFPMGNFDMILSILYVVFCATNCSKITFII